MAVTLEICWPAMTVHLLSTLANRPCLRFILTGLMQCGFECSMGLLGLFHINSWHWIFLKLFCPSFHAGMNGTGQGKSRSHCNILLPWARSLTVKACCRLEPAAALWQEAEQHQAKRLIHLTELDNFTLSFARSSMCRRLFPKPALPSKKPPDTQTSFTHAQFASTAASSPMMCTMPEVLCMASTHCAAFQMQPQWYLLWVALIFPHLYCYCFLWPTFNVYLPLHSGATRMAHSCLEISWPVCAFVLFHYFELVGLQQKFLLFVTRGEFQSTSNWFSLLLGSVLSFVPLAQTITYGPSSFSLLYYSPCIVPYEN